MFKMIGGRSASRSLSQRGGRCYYPAPSLLRTPCLPEETTSAQSLTSFRRHFKTRLFSQSYPDLIIWSLL